MSGRAVLVTGAATGIGWATARRFAAAGDRVLIADIDGPRAEAQAALLGPSHAAFRADVSVRSDVDAMLAACVKRFGRIDVLVNNAGRIDTSGTGVVDQPTAAFRSLLALNLEGTYHAAMGAVAVMQAQGGGAIVNVASGAALRAIPLRNAYSASKAGVAAMTRTLACRHARDGIQVNAIAPGYTRTELVDALIENGRVDPSLVHRRIPLGRMGTPEEMAEAIFHLASPAARAMVGDLVLVDGGGQAFGGSDDASIARGAKPTPPPAGPSVVVIAGADSRIGSAVARLLGADGAKLVLLNRTVDVTDREAVDDAITAAVGQFGRIDALVNALVGDDVADGCREWSIAHGLDLHLTGTFHIARAVGRVMLEQGNGAICNIVSAVGACGFSGSDGAAATAAALVMFSRTLACEWGGSGIRTNALAVGPVGDAAPALLARMPLRRAITADEVAAHARYLITQPSAYVNGALVTVDGGLGIYAGTDLPIA